MADDRDLYCTGYRLRKATRRITHLYDTVLAPHDLTLTQFSLLALLTREGPARLSVVAEKAGMDRTSLTRTIQPMVRAGHVRIGGDEGDRRARILVLTSDGRAAFEAAVPAWQSAQRTVHRTLGRAEVEHLHGLLANIGQIELDAGQTAEQPS